MAKTTRHTAFEGLHPAFAALYFVAVLVLTMACIHPVMVALSLAGAVAYHGRLRGVRAVAASLVWQVPLLVLIAVANPLFSQYGDTVLLQIGTWALCGESLAYGTCMGGLLVATFQWFGSAAQVLTSDKLQVLLGRRAPMVGLLLTMTMRLVPQFVRRGQAIGQVQSACTAAGQKAIGLSAAVRQVTVLMGWGMEDSLETADAMRARGWGASDRRTTYQRCHFGRYDGVACALLAVLVAACVACAWMACGSFVFYPVMGPWAPVMLYVPWCVLLTLPWGLEVLSA